MRELPVAVLLTIAFNCAIAALLTLVGFGGTFLENLVYSQSIGLTVLLVVHAGWRIAWSGARPPAGPMAALVALGILAGWLGGTALAAAILQQSWRPAHSGGAVLAITAAAGLAGTFFFWTRERAAQLERQSAEAQLRLLQAQVEPHFLFNTLANLQALIGTDPRRAQAMLEHLNGY
ncbi:MAG: histidine kinase, partial [Pseudomonadota bacterium]